MSDVVILLPDGGAGAGSCPAARVVVAKSRRPTEIDSVVADMGTGDCVAVLPSDGMDPAMARGMLDEARRRGRSLVTPVVGSRRGGRFFGGSFRTNGEGWFGFVPRTLPPGSEEVPCVFPGAYAASAAWHRLLRGHLGMNGCGGVPYVALSIKSWLCGGNCVVDRRTTLPLVDVPAGSRDEDGADALVLALAVVGGRDGHAAAGEITHGVLDGRMTAFAARGACLVEYDHMRRTEFKTDLDGVLRSLEGHRR